MFSKPAGSCSKDRTRPCSPTTASAASIWGCEKPERREESMSRENTWVSLLSAALVGAAAAALPVGVSAQQPKEVEIAIIVPLSGPWARQGLFERVRADIAIDDINKSGVIQALG